MTKITLLEQLKQQKVRLTPARKALIGIFESNQAPLTQDQIRKTLKVNKTTVYREVEVLQKLGVVKAVDFGDGKKRFELSAKDHHHHLVCTNCDRVEDVFVENEVLAVENKIRKEKKFQIKSHSLEFFGVCASCAD